jgi:MYXO-CTERM domain-containing protein
MRPMRAFLACAALASTVIVPAAARADVINVTPADSFAKIEAAKPGDEVVLAPGTYAFRLHLTQKAPADKPIVIRAAEPKNRPIVDFGGKLVEDAPGSYGGGDKGRGCWQLSGATNIQISGIEFRNCHNSDHNAAGIRYYNGSSVTISDCIFRKNDNGLTGGTQESTALVQFCEFDTNGNTQASAPTHNIYNYGGTFTLRYSYLHDPTQGQNFHIRAKSALIEYNWIARAKSYSGDLMTGDDCGNGNCTQNMTLRGNLIIQGMPMNTGQIVAVYNDTGAPNMQFHVKAIANTVVASSLKAHFVHLSNADGTPMTAELDNNLIAGGGEPVLVETAGKSMVSGKNNWLSIGTSPGQLTGTVLGSNPFKNAAALDFTLATGSNAIGAAAALASGTPDREYFRNEMEARMYRVRATAKDIGAFEFATMGNGIGPDDMMPPGGTGGAGPTSAATSGTGASSAASGAGGHDGDAAADIGPEGPVGCGCTTAREPSPWGIVAVAAIAALAWRRRS